MPIEEKKLTRKEKKDAKLGQQISSEAKEYGVDIDKPIVPVGPLGAKKKAEIDKRILDYAQEDLREGLKKFQSLKKGPEETSPILEKDRLKRSLRREKRARFGDILTAFGRSFQGKEIGQLQAPKIRKERTALYNQYKDAVAQSRKKLSEWESKYTDEQLDYLDSKLKDSKTSELEKQKIKKIKAQIEKTKVEADWLRKKPYSKASAKVKPIYTHKTKEGNWQLTNQKQPYSDLYYKLTGNSPTLINELAKISGHATDKTGSLKRNLSTDEIERFSNTLLSKAFEIQVDDQGNQIAIPKKGKEQFLQNISSSIEETNSLKKQLEEIESQRESEIYNVSGWGKSGKIEDINEKYDQIVSTIKNNLKVSEDTLRSMLEGNDIESNSSKETKATDNDTDFMNIVNEYKK